MNRLLSLCVLIALVVLAAAPVVAQRGRGAAPATPQAMQDVANAIVAAVNGQDAEALGAMVAETAVYLDEDGHAIPAAIWVGRITSDPPRVLRMSGMRGETWGDTGWVSFNYELDETFEGQPVTVPGTVSFVLQQVGGNWTIRMVHGAMEQHVANVAAARP